MSRTISKALILGNALLLCCGPLTAAATDVLLVDRMEPAGGVVRLADVAAILNAAPEEIERLGALPLMPAPAPGTAQTISAQSIRELLEAHGVDLTNVRFRGAAEVRVSKAKLVSSKPPTVDLPRDESGSAPLTGFRGTYASNPGPRQSVRRPIPPRRVRLSSRVKQQTVKLLADQLTTYVQAQTRDDLLYVVDLEIKDHNTQVLAAHKGEVRISSTTSVRKGHMRFLVEFSSAAGDVRFPVFADVVEAEPAVMVRREIQRGAIITAADVHIAPLPIEYRARGIEMIYESVSDVIGREAGARLKPGDVATDANCLPPRMVRRGEVVTVSAGRGPITVRTQAKAMREGRLGEIITVQTIDTRRPFQARVVGPSELAVLSAGSAAVREVASRVEPLRIR